MQKLFSLGILNQAEIDKMVLSDIDDLIEKNRLHDERVIMIIKHYLANDYSIEWIDKQLSTYKDGLVPYNVKYYMNSYPDKFI